MIHVTELDCAVLMNRDYNAAMNIRQNLLNYIQHQQWAERFTRNPTPPIITDSGIQTPIVSNQNDTLANVVEDEWLPRLPKSRRKQSVFLELEKLQEMITNLDEIALVNIALILILNRIWTL